MTSKKLLSALMALVFALSLFTALPVSADGVTATVGGVAVADGGQISAASTVVFTLPEAVADLTAVTLSEQLKTQVSDAYPWYVRNFEGELSNEGKTLTVVFERGDLTSNGTYKFEFDTDSATDGAEYIFNFVTVPEVDATGATILFAENFEKYSTANGQKLGMGGFAANDSSANNLVPLRKTRGYTGGVNDNAYYVGVVDYDGGRAFKPYAATNFSCYGVDPRYGGTISGLNHVGVLTYEYEPTTVNSIIDFAGVTIDMEDSSEGAADGTVWKIYGETTAKVTTGDAGFDASKHQLLATVNVAANKVLDWHKVEMIVDTTLTAGYVETRKLVEIKLDGNVVWKQSATNSFTLASSGSGSYNKGVPFMSATATSNTGRNSTSMFMTAGARSYIRYFEYKEYIAEPLTIASTANDYAANNTISWTFDNDIALSSVIDNVVLERQDISDNAWYAMDAKAFMSVAADGKTLKATFANGDLTAGMNYRMKITAGAKHTMGGALAADSAYVNFTAKVQDHYYMNDTFEQYKENWGWQGDSLVQANPWRFHAGWTGNPNASGKTQSNAGIRIAADGSKYLCIDPSTMQSFTFKQTYARPLPEGETGLRGITEAQVSFVGSGILYEINGVGIQPMADGTWNIFYRGDGGDLEVGLGYGTRVAGDQYFTEIGSYASGDTALNGSEKHTIAIDSDIHYEWITGTWRTIRTIYGIKVDGVNILAEQIGNGIKCDFPGYFADGTFFNDAITPLKNANNAFFATSVNGAGSGEMWVHSISYRDAISVDAAQSGTTLTFTVKNDSAKAVSAIPVLAVYNGNDFVRVDGLNAAATSIAAGATETFTKTVTADEADYTYKFMLLDSADSLMPLWYATKGTIN